jgi:uncharacterized membrane protein YbhN (UPF0104 family)
MRLFTLLWDSYIARLFLRTEGGWFFAPYRSGELLQKVTDEQRDALLALYRKLFVSHLILEALVVLLLVASIPAVALSFSDGVNYEEARLARDGAVAMAALFFGWVVGSVTYQVTRTKRIIGHRDFLPPRADRHEISRHLNAQYERVWAPYQGATRMAMFISVAVLVVAMILALSGTTHTEDVRGASSPGYLYLYTSAQLAAVYAIFKYHRHSRQINAAAG